MEVRDRVPKEAAILEAACRELCAQSAQLVNGVGKTRVSKRHLEELALLTLGAQLRGGKNVQMGAQGILAVFEAIAEIVKPAVVEQDEGQIAVKSGAGRRVVIRFAPDPDIVIEAEMAGGAVAKSVAIEVKAGRDFSNIHNRIGEAEKSHQKAKRDGFSECWTVVNVDPFDRKLAHSESPSTNRFFHLSAIQSRSGGDFEDFRSRIIHLTGIPS